MTKAVVVLAPRPTGVGPYRTLRNQKREQKEATCYSCPLGIKILTQPLQRRSHQQVRNNGAKTLIKLILALLVDQNIFLTFHYVPTLILLSDSFYPIHQKSIKLVIQLQKGLDSIVMKKRRFISKCK